jgi:hypothetical protein
MKLEFNFFPLQIDESMWTNTADSEYTSTSQRVSQQNEASQNEG